MGLRLTQTRTITEKSGTIKKELNSAAQWRNLFSLQWRGTITNLNSFKVKVSQNKGKDFANKTGTNNGGTI